MTLGHVPGLMAVSLECTGKLDSMARRHVRRSACCADGCQIHRTAIIWFLIMAASCSVAPMLGTDHGWAIWHQSNYMRDESPYVSLLKMVIIEHPEIGIESSDLDVLNRFLPHVPMDITLRQGWLKSVSHIQLHIENSKPVSRLMRDTTFAIVPEHMHGQLSNVLDRGIERNEKPYEGDRLPGRYTGAAVIVVLGIAVIMALVVLWSWRRNGFFGGVHRFLRRSWTISVLIYCTVIIEYVVLAIGAHEEMRSSPVTQHGHIPRPDWAWIVAASSATSWAIVAVLSRRIFKPEAMETPKKCPHSVAPKTSWNIPVSYEDGQEKSTEDMV